MSDKPRIACCAIVKDEEEVLERMIKSVEFMVDKFIIFDTGSTDSTKKIIKKYGEVYETQFTNFVDTKNKVLEFVDSLPDIDYILWMDADEFLKENPTDLLKHVIDNPDVDYFETFISDITLDDKKTINYTRNRIWKNHNYNNGWKFVGPRIHEAMFIPSNKRVVDKNIVVWHKHKLKGKNYHKTFDFYVKNLTEHLQENPDDTRGWFYLARTYKDMQKWDDALKNYHQYLEVAKKINYYWKDEQYLTMLDASTCYVEKNDISKAIYCLDCATKIDPRRADAYVLLSKLYLYNDKIKDLEKSKDYAKTAFKLPPPDDVILFFDPKYHFEYPLDILSLICWETKEYKEGCTYIDKFLNSKYISENDKIRIQKNKELFLKQLEIENEQKQSLMPVFHTIDNYFERVFVINLRQREDRWIKCKERLEKFGIYKAERYYGINGEILKPLVDENVLVKRTGGYLGCLISHLDLIWQAKQNGWRNILIMEDDNLFYNNLQPAFHDIIVDLETNHKDFDIILFGHATFDGHYQFEKEKNGEMRYQTTIKKYDSPLQPAHNSWGCSMYCINFKFYQVILDYYKDKFEWELDRFLLNNIFPYPEKYKALISYPQLVIQNGEEFSDNFKGKHANWDNFINTEYSDRKDYI